MSDFGHQARTMWNRFKDHPDELLGYQASDEVLYRRLADAKKGDRSKTFAFMAALCGDDFAGDQLRPWLDGKGEQPTSSLPQSVELRRLARLRHGAEWTSTWSPGPAVWHGAIWGISGAIWGNQA